MIFSILQIINGLNVKYSKSFFVKIISNTGYTTKERHFNTFKNTYHTVV